MWKEPDVASFEALPWHLLEGTEENRKNLSVGTASPLGLDFNPGLTQIKKQHCFPLDSTINIDDPIPITMSG